MRNNKPTFDIVRAKKRGKLRTSACTRHWEGPAVFTLIQPAAHPRGEMRRHARWLSSRACI